jgi:Uma2 family endonuclease
MKTPTVLLSSALTDGDEVLYPCSDGEPMANNEPHAFWIRFIWTALENHFRKRREDVAVMADCFWYPIQGVNTIRVAPDVMLAFGRPHTKRRGSFKPWEEGGVSPQVVFEVLSPSNTVAEMQRKLSFFERHGVEEYYLYDCDDHSISAYYRDPSQPHRLIFNADLTGWISPRMGVGFELDPQGGLRIYTPEGHSLQHIEEIVDDRDRAEAEREMSEAERQKAEAERQKAEAERQKAEAERDRLRAKLIAAGIEPDESGTDPA